MDRKVGLEVLYFKQRHEGESRKAKVESRKGEKRGGLKDR
jgi:hypothetical protein